MGVEQTGQYLADKWDVGSLSRHRQMDTGS
jgi:hypothetical protein